MNTSRMELKSFDLRSPSTGKMFVWSPAFLPEPGSARYSSAPSITTVSDLTIRLHVTTSLKSISQIRWLYHQLFKNWCYRHAVQLNVNQSMSRDQSFFVLIGPIAFSWYPVMINHKYVNIQTSVVGPQ